MDCVHSIMKKHHLFRFHPISRCTIASAAGAGEAISLLLMEYRNYTFPEALEVLNRIGVELPKQELSAEQKWASDKKARLLEANKEAAKYFYTFAE